MSTIFVTSIKENAELAEKIRKDLETKGYTCWRELDYPTPGEASYPHVIENAILGSAALILLWSARAAQDTWLNRWLHFAQSLKKLVIPVTLDGTALPALLITAKNVDGQGSSQDIVATPQHQRHMVGVDHVDGRGSSQDIVATLLPLLPAPESKEALIVLGEQAASELLRIRREAIDAAGDMLKRHEHREAVLAMLEYLAQHDLITGVREKAQEVLEAEHKSSAQTPERPILKQHDVRHSIRVQCGKCGHISPFDRRFICLPQSTVTRSIIRSGGKEMHHMDLPCKQCGHIIPTRVDCEGYR